ncbi:MAG: ACP S-malonyltransferase [Bacteroidota bacterium]
MLAFIFPGQGSQYVGMGQDLYERSQVAKALLDEMAAAVDFPLPQLMFEGPAEELTKTQNAQPALLAHCVMVNALLRQEGVKPDVVAGHSLGEYSAVTAADCLPATEAIRLVRLRGELMAQAGEQVGGTMAAVIGLETEAVRRAAQAAGEVGTIVVANLNAPGQVVISGEEKAVTAAAALMKEAGAKRVLPLNVSGAFHSPLMLPASEKLGEALAQTEFADAAVHVISNVDAVDRMDAASIKAALLRQLTGSVLWEDCVNRMVQTGVTTFVEVGPGKVLSGLVGRIAVDVTCYRTDTFEGIEETVAAIKAGA